MKRLPSDDLRKFRRTLTPRPIHWLQNWLVQFVFFAVVICLAERLLGGELLFLAAFMAACNVIGGIYHEWRTQPRRLMYWSEDAPAGIVIRHLRTGESLFHTAGNALRSEDLRGVCLEGADLRAEQLRGLDLRGARLRGSNLEEAALQDCCLDEADLAGCRLVGAWLRGASLKGADLRGADLGGRGATRALTTGRLEGAHFFGARYNAATRWPTGFDPAAHGCAYENDAEQALPIPTSGGIHAVGSLPIVGTDAAPEGSPVLIARKGERS